MNFNCSFCNKDMTALFQQYSLDPSPSDDGTCYAMCYACGEVMIVDPSGFRKPQDGEYEVIATNGALNEMRALWMQANGDDTVESNAIIETYYRINSAMEASNIRKSTKGVVDCVFWAAAKSALFAFKDVLDKEKIELPAHVWEHLDVLRSLVETGEKRNRSEFRSKGF